MIAAASSPGKVILFGEHFVVYGAPAIVSAINRRARVIVQPRGDEAIQVVSDLGIAGIFDEDRFKRISGGNSARKGLEPVKIAARAVIEELDIRTGLNITVRSEIPVAVGLGSSGAVAVATVSAVGRLLGKTFTRDDIFRLSFEPERFVHKDPSGIDQTISTFGGTIRYERDKGITDLGVIHSLPLVIGNTGILRSTGDLVAMVRGFRDEDPERFQRLLIRARQISENAVEALHRNDLERLGQLMNQNQELLDAIGASHKALDKAIEAARESGALGAKLTGAGGGGCMIALAPPGETKSIAKSIAPIVEPISVEVTKKGVISWLKA
ncbi:MAG: mevalonate kinase [Candidatus Bathyarchaeia archaeon]